MVTRGTMRLTGKTALITGAASGIGAATAELFAAEGANVVIADIDRAHGKATADRIKAFGGTATFVHTDLRNESQIVAMIGAAYAQYGRLDILHNNAACFEADLPVAETTLAQWEKVIDINLRAIFLACRTAIPRMVAQDGGVIINTASVLGVVGTASFAPYMSSKGGIIQLTRSIAIDYGRKGIRANALCPGMTATPTAEPLLNDPAEHQALVDKTVLGRVAEPREIAAAALFLASDDASYVTGSCLFVDGGWTCM